MPKPKARLGRDDRCSRDRAQARWRPWHKPCQWLRRSKKAASSRPSGVSGDWPPQCSAAILALSPPAQGFPTTVIYDASGHEKARLADGADWTSPEAHAVFDTLLKAG